MKKHLVFVFLILSTAFLNVALAQNKRIAILEAIDREDSIPYSVALMYVSIFMPLSHCFDYCSFAI